jgi:hypothetical protein
MSLLDESGPDDQELVRYLLGLLSEEETERLDELSITDDEMAWRLCAAENDLVDAYVSGGLTGETLERFESFYLSSPRRCEKVKDAGIFLRRVDRDISAPAKSRRDLARASPQRVTTSSAWRLAAAAALVLACGALLFQVARLRSGLDETRRESAALDRRAHDLERQLNDQRAANANTVKELERVRGSVPPLAQQSAAVRPRERTEPASAALTAALVLLPQMRAVHPIATLALPEHADRVRFDLRLESSEFPRYQVALKNPATNQIIWRSGQIAPASSGDTPTVSVVIPAGILKPQHYALELLARSAAGDTEVVGTYAVRIEAR